MRKSDTASSHPARFSILAALLGCASTAAAQTEFRAAPDDYELVALGETIEFGDGHSITVSRYEEDVPYTAETVVGSHAGVINFWYAKICDGDADLEDFVSEVYFTAVQAPGWASISGSGHLAPGVREPRLNDSYVPTSLVAGSCAEGWVAAGATDATTVLPEATAICFDSARIGAVREGLQVKFAWALE